MDEVIGEWKPHETVPNRSKCVENSYEIPRQALL